MKRAKREASKLAAKQEKDAKLQESKQEPADEANLDSEKVASTTPPKRPDLKELNKDLPSGWQVSILLHQCCHSHILLHVPRY